MSYTAFHGVVRRLSAAAFTLVAALCLCSHASGEIARFEEKCDVFLAQRAASQPLNTSVSALLTSPAPLTTLELAQLESLGLTLYAKCPLVNAICVRGSISALLSAAELPYVTRISEDVPIRKSDLFTVGSSMAGAAFQQFGLTGSGIRVAVLDSGIKTSNSEFRKRIVASVNMVTYESGAEDENGHGTHVAGIIAGNGSLSTGSSYYRTFYGIARGADIVNVRVLDAEGAGNVANVINGIDWVIQNRGRYNIRVMNLSLGHPVGDSYANDPLCQAVEKAWKAGIVVVVAAGNSGRANSGIDSSRDNEGYGAAYGSIESPGNSPYAITVGATKDMDGIRAHDQIATYSSRGPSRVDFVLKPDLVAPGNRVISLNNPGGFLDGEYASANRIPYSAYVKGGSASLSPYFFKLSGTSMAAGVVSGAASMMLQANPTLTPDTIKARLMLTADKWAHPDGTADACTFGAGYLNVGAALKSTVVALMPAMSPSLYRDSDGNVCIDMNNAIWGVNAIWGTGLTQLNAIWGSNALWGSNVLWGSNALWGSSIWTSNAIWGTSIAQSTAVRMGGE